MRLLLYITRKDRAAINNDDLERVGTGIRGAKVIDYFPYLKLVLLKDSNSHLSSAMIGADSRYDYMQYANLKQEALLHAIVSILSNTESANKVLESAKDTYMKDVLNVRDSAEAEQVVSDEEYEKFIASIEAGILDGVEFVKVNSKKVL